MNVAPPSRLMTKNWVSIGTASSVLQRGSPTGTANHVFASNITSPFARPGEGNSGASDGSPLHHPGLVTRQSHTENVPWTSMT